MPPLDWLQFWDCFSNFAAQPNNRVQWFCPAFVTPFQEKPDYVTNTRGMEG